MFTIGITKGRWNTLVTALQQFKDDYDKNQPLWRDPARVLSPSIRATSASACATCAQQIHDIYKANDVARVTTEMYLSDMQPAMKPSDAFAAHGAPRNRPRARSTTSKAASPACC